MLVSVELADLMRLTSNSGLCMSSATPFGPALQVTSVGFSLSNEFARTCTRCDRGQIPPDGWV